MSKLNKVKDLIKKRLEEESATGTGASFTAGTGENYATPVAGKAKNYYYKLGYKPVNKKALNKAFADDSNQSLILEDDIFFKSNNFINELKNIIICPWKIIFLGAPILEKKIFLNKWAHCDKFPGTYGYIIKKELIQKTLSLINNMENSIDLIFMKHLHKYDYCFILNDFVLTDIVDSDTSKKKPIFQKLIDNLNKDLI